MAEWKGKSRGAPAGYKFFVLLIKYLGLTPAYLFLRIVAGWFFVFATATTNRIMFTFFHQRIGFNRVKSRIKIYKNYVLLGQVLIDKIAVMSGYSSKITGVSHGSEHLKAMFSLKKGGILLGAHLGNWEIAGHFLLNYTGKINIVMYDGEHENIKQFMENVTGGRKYNVIPIKKDLSHVYAIGEALQNEEIVCMHADRFVEGNRTTLVPFLGEDAQFPIGPFQLIKTFRANYTFVYGVKTGWTKYNFFARPYRQATAESTIEGMVKDYANDLEGMVKQYPEQWFNYYDFWKKN